MRLLHAISTLNPAGGGPAEALRQRLQALAALGHQSEVACLDEPQAPWLVGFPTVVAALGPGRLGNYGYSHEWQRWMRQNYRRFDTVVINGLWQYNGLGTRQALPREYPYFVFPHGMLDPWFKRTYPLKHLKKWLYWPWAEYRVLRDARAVLFTSEEERRLAPESFGLYRCNAEVVNYGTAGPSGDEAEQKKLFLTKYPKLREQKRLLFLGRVHVKKGPEILLRAFARLRATAGSLAGNVHLVMVGPNDHPYGNELKALTHSLGLADRVTWTGLLRADLKWGAFYSADAFILPSHQENFGIAVAESLACGVPVLISNQVNIWREVAAAQAGFVDTDTSEGTLRLLQKWVSTSGADWRVMQQNARNCFAEKFHIQQAARSLVRVIRAHGVGSEGDH